MSWMVLRLYRRRLVWILICLLVFLKYIGISSGNRVGYKSIDLAPYKQLYIHLEQINSAHNFLDGAASKVLSIVPVENKSFGDIVHINFSNPEYKQLSHGDISELSISVCDENNNKIDNHGLPISCVLEII